MNAAVNMILPGSPAFFIFGLLIGLWLSGRRGRLAGWGRQWLWALVLAYLVFSLPAGSRLISAPLSWGFSPLVAAEAARGAQAVVLLDGGTSRCRLGGRLVEKLNEPSSLRVLEGLRVSDLLGEPLIVATGGVAVAAPDWSPEAEAMQKELLRAGVPAERILLDPSSRNTREHAVTVTRLLAERGIETFVLVTSATHIRRSAAAFRAAGGKLVASPAPGRCDGSGKGWRAFWPSVTGLAETEAAMHDYLGLLYYWGRGWL